MFQFHGIEDDPEIEKGIDLMLPLIINNIDVSLWGLLKLYYLSGN